MQHILSWYILYHSSKAFGNCRMGYLRQVCLPARRQEYIGTEHFRMIAGFRWVDSFWLLLGAMSYASMAAELWRRRAAGAVLLDLGTLAGRVRYLILGAMTVVVSLTMTRVSHDKMWYWAAVGIGFNTIADGMRRYQIRDAGIFGRAPRWIRWERISGYELSPAGSLSLSIDGKKLLFYCHVPPEKLAEAGKLMASRGVALLPESGLRAES